MKIDKKELAKNIIVVIVSTTITYMLMMCINAK